LFLISLLLISLVILLAGIAGSVALTVRTGEARVGLLGVCFTLLAGRQGLALWNSWDAPLAWNAGLAAELAVLAACGVGVWILAALWRTLQERDKAESLHWDSMEAVRVLGELADRSNLSLDEKFEAVLKIGCEFFGLETGIVSRVHRQRYEIIAIRAPETFPVSRGAVFMLAETHCDAAVAAERPVVFERVDDAASGGRHRRDAFGFRAYLGSAVRVHGEVVGTLCFGSPRARSRRFTATDKDLLVLMSQFVGTEIERRLVAEQRRSQPLRGGATETRISLGARLRDARIPRSVDVNAAVKRAEHRLRGLVGPEIAVEYQLAPELKPAKMLRVAVGSLLEWLVTRAAEAASGPGTLHIATANLDVATGDPDLVPAVAPDQYVTVSVRITAEGIDAESFERAIDAPATRKQPEAGVSPGEPLSLTSIYRLVQRSGGDLSLDIERGRSATFTVFLPRAASSAELPATLRGPAASPA
jgi:hypothetical protein